MRSLLDTSVLVAALMPDEASHNESLALLRSGQHVVYVHALLETFSTLTGGKAGMKVDADFATRLLCETVRPLVSVIQLSEDDMLAALRAAREHGVRGGAVYDYMHLVAARKAGAEAIITLNVSNFEHLVREGDPMVRRP